MQQCTLQSWDQSSGLIRMLETLIRVQLISRQDTTSEQHARARRRGFIAL